MPNSNRPIRRDATVVASVGQCELGISPCNDKTILWTKQICVEPPSSDLSMTLPAVAVDRRRLQKQ